MNDCFEFISILYFKKDVGANWNSNLQIISDWRAEKKLNKETFGVAGNRGYNRGYQGYNRGYNNRGYYNNRQVDFSLLQK